MLQQMRVAKIRQSRSEGATRDSGEFQAKVTEEYRQMRLYKHFSIPNSLFIAMSNSQTPCINYEQLGVVNIKYA